MTIFFHLHSLNLYFARKTKYTAKNLEFWGNPNTRFKTGLKKKKRRVMASSLRGLKRGYKERFRGSQFTWSDKKINQDNPLFGSLTRICKLNLPYSMQTAFSENLIDFDYLEDINVRTKWKLYVKVVSFSSW